MVQRLYNPMPLTPGTKLGGYKILALIGAGGMGEVYRANDPKLGRDLALKVSAEQFNERFERGARAVATRFDDAIVADAVGLIGLEGSHILRAHHGYARRASGSFTQAERYSSED